MTGFEATIFVFIITDENNSSSFTTQRRWIPTGGEELINKIKDISERRSKIDIELHVKEAKNEVLE